MLVTCNGCKQDLPAEMFAVDKSRPTGRRYKCRACSSEEFKRWRATEGYARRLATQKSKRNSLKITDPKKRWAGYALNNAKRRAAKSGISFTITLAWVEANAPDNCPALGFPLKYDNSASFRDSPAVDRIDNSRGYEPDNCWVVSMLANRIKTNATVDELEAVARAVRLVQTRVNPYAA